MINEKEKRLAEIFHKIESPKTQDDLLFQAEYALRIQEALKKDYGLGDLALPKQDTAGLAAAGV